MLFVELELAPEETVCTKLLGELTLWAKNGERGVCTRPACCRLAEVVAVACEDSDDSLEREGARSFFRVKCVRFMLKITALTLTVISSI